MNPVVVTARQYLQTWLIFSHNRNNPVNGSCAVDEISNESAADKAVETATDMMEDLEDGLVRED